MTGPFRIEGPAILSVSGGRTSGLMLRRVLDAHGGALPPDVVPVFCNTGREFPATLDFLRDIGERWGVRIVWLERTGRRLFREVTHATAARDGEPFEKLIRERKYLPNPSARFCTTALKIETSAAYARSLGWETWTDAVGLRADEPMRVAKRRAANAADRDRTAVCPLASAGVTRADVDAFWRAQPFDLRLQPGESNCDLCFMKGWRLRQRIVADHPETSAWWERMEADLGARFHRDAPPYAAIARTAAAQTRMLPVIQPAEESLDCGCTD